MSKKKKLKLSNKPGESLPKVSEKLQNNPENLSPSLPVNTSENLSTNETIDFQNAINQSKNSIAEAEANKGKRGRKALPRDKDGNIIRDASNPVSSVNSAPQVLNQASIEENKSIIKTVFPVINGVAEKYAGTEKARATVDEETALINASAHLMEKYLPTIMGKYGMEASFAFVLIAWGKRVQALRTETIAEFKATEKKKSELHNGGLPTQGVGPQ